MSKKAILKLYKVYEQDKNSSEQYNKLLREFNELRDMFDKQITTRQQKKLEKILYLMKSMCSVETKESFIDRIFIIYKTISRIFIRRENIKTQGISTKVFPVLITFWNLYN